MTVAGLQDGGQRAELTSSFLGNAEEFGVCSSLIFEVSVRSRRQDSRHNLTVKSRATEENPERRRSIFQSGSRSSGQDLVDSIHKCRASLQRIVLRRYRNQETSDHGSRRQDRKNSGPQEGYGHH